MILTLKYQVIFPLLARLPGCFAYPLVSYLSKLIKNHSLEDRENMLSQMQKVFKHFDDTKFNRLVDNFYMMVEREAFDTYYFRTLSTSDQVQEFIELKDFHHVKLARQSGRKVIISSGHFGRFWMAGVGMKNQGVSVGTITRDGADENVHNLPRAEHQYRLKKLAWLQQCFGGPFLVEGDSVRPIYKALDEHVMAVFIDVPYVGEKRGCIELPFLGKKARFPLGVAKIAKKTGAEIVPFYVFEKNSKLITQFYPAIDTDKLSEEDIMQRLVELLEKQITQYPECWWLWPALPLMWQE